MERGGVARLRHDFIPQAIEALAQLAESNPVGFSTASAVTLHALLAFVPLIPGYTPNPVMAAAPPALRVTVARAVAAVAATLAHPNASQQSPAVRAKGIHADEAVWSAFDAYRGPGIADADPAARSASFVVRCSLTFCCPLLLSELRAAGLPVHPQTLFLRS